MCGGNTLSTLYKNIVKDINKKGRHPEHALE